MPSVLSDSDKETVRRTVPKSANKIHAVAVARLYVAYPNTQRWTHTGLQGAVVLANDLVGNTYWIKLVDVSGSNRGVIWDQEIYDPFYYNQDRTFFHSFELEACLAGLSFADEKEAKQFKKKMDDREKNASKGTKATAFQGSSPMPAGGGPTNGKSHSRLGGLGSLLHGHRSSSAPSIPQPQQQSIIPPREHSNLAPPSPTRGRGSSLDAVDPSWRGILGELLEMGITEDQIEEHSDFIRNYIEQKQATSSTQINDDGLANVTSNERRGKAPPPPPPPTQPSGRMVPISPQHTGSTVSSKRGPPPAPPPARRSRQDGQSVSSPTQPQDSPPESPQRTPSPPRSAFRFKAPPPFKDAGKLANVAVPLPPARQRAASNLANPGPPPPPRPPKTPVEDEPDSRPKFGVPPPFQGERASPAAPPPPPSRGPIPSSPPASRVSSQAHAVPPSAALPPPLPPKTPNAPTSSLGPPPPPPLPSQRNVPSAPPPPPLPTTARPAPSFVASSNGPPPPPLPTTARPTATNLQSSNAPPPPPPPPPLPFSNAPPPPPMPSRNGSSAPPLPPGRTSAMASPLPTPTGGRDDVMASIRASGGVGGGRLKKVSSQEKRDRSAALTDGVSTTNQSGSGASPAPSSGGGLADALAAALSQRNKKVSASDDEDDDDDWDDPPKRR
ncbi:hypothetical protein MMC12_004908 [Toensbergia leucococca]|nr:hypothetical protein [Toensbergia leucococca]